MENQIPNQLSTIGFRLGTVERSIVEIKQELSLYVPARENALQFSDMQNIIGRIALDVQETKKQLAEVNNHLRVQESEIQESEAAQRASQAALQIKVLGGAVSTIVMALVGILIGYINHFFH